MNEKLGAEIMKSVFFSKNPISNQEKLQEFELKLLENQQSLIMNLNSKPNEYLSQLSKLLSHKDKKSHTVKRKTLVNSLRSGNFNPNANEHIAFNNFVEDPLTTNDFKVVLTKENNFKYPEVKEEQNEDEDSFEKFNFSHRNDYLDSEFSFNENHKEAEKEKVVFKGLRQKYCFYPFAEEMSIPPRKKSDLIPNLKHIVSASKSVNLMKGNNMSSMSKDKDGGIFSKTGINFSLLNVKKNESKLPVLKNNKSANMSKLPKIIINENVKKEKQSINKARKTLERILNAF